MTAHEYTLRRIADLELSIAPLAEGFGLTLRYQRPGDAGEDRRGPFPIQLKTDQLTALSLDPMGVLATMLLRSPK